MAAATAFVCFRCGSEKKAKLVTVLAGDWDRLLCNGCYGRLLSLYEIRSGTTDTSEITDALADHLLGMIPAADARRAEEVLRLREVRTEVLDSKALRLLATAEYVSSQLAHTTGLDWSAAIIGVCKAVEIEVGLRVIDPLAGAASGEDLASDIRDKDIGRVAKYCAGRSAKPPELGVVRHFLQTTAHSVDRQASSPLMRSFRHLVRDWPHGDWLLDPKGAITALESITGKYRNPAAHTDELGPDDYMACVSDVLGEEGTLWMLVRSTS